MSTQTLTSPSSPLSTPPSPATPLSAPPPTAGPAVPGYGLLGGSRPAALWWEFWRLTRVRILALFVGVVCINALYFQMATLVSEELPPEVQTNLFMATFFTNVCLIVVVLLRARDVDPRTGTELEHRFFLLPLPTWQLTLWRMAFPALTAGLLWVAVSRATLAMTPRGATGDSWPLLGPALVTMVFTALALSVAWLPLRSKALRMLFDILLLAGPLVWTIRRFDPPGPGPGTMWQTVTPGELLTLLGWLLVAYALAVFAVIQARRGVTLDRDPLQRLADARARYRRPATGRPFHNATTAQLWFEWRQNGWLIPLMAVCAVLCVATLTGWQRDTQTIFSAVLQATVFYLLAAPPMLGCALGRFDQSSQKTRIDVFRASRPLTDCRLAYIVLTAGVFGLVATWLGIVLSTTLLLGALDLVHGGGHLEAARWKVDGMARSLGWSDGTLALTSLVVLSWTNMALVASAFLTGRKGVVGTLVVGPYALAVGAYLAFATMDFASVSDLVVVASGFFSGLALVGTAVAFVVARRRRLIAPWIPVVAVVGIVVLAGVCVLPRLEEFRGFYDTGVTLGRATLALIPGVLALAAAPLALAPLALAWNRHR